ncbi:DUF1877 family protein [Asanoa iriomotensis]|uniref:DUF1877 family protein n=1 Tax=Asanoa iriomotensis TaxID=234613 RepID=A0ABQ4CE07_9ACTN|nr:DUF1877 family protein [Asanoa iriomotensis]GIF61002.1 hypothetical protein Air01nite_70970 [Asanoa iriomotensis]
MYGMWLRVTPAELARGRDDLDWLQEHAEAIVEIDDDARWNSTDKTWHALDHLLRRRGFPVSIVLGEECFVDDEEDTDVDWGYGPPRYLTPEQVRAAAEALAALTEADLIEGVDVADLAKAEIYPSVWDDPAELPWAAHALPSAQTLFAEAAKDGDAIICWIE